MGAFDLPQLLSALPLPVVVTYRPRREGGRYEGDERVRLRTLRRAASLGASVVDVEWDAVDAWEGEGSLLMVSRHFFDGLPSSPEAVWAELAPRADIVKLAAYAHTLTDALRLCALWRTVNKPTVLIAMGRAGIVTRLCAPHFPHAFLTYGSPTAGQEVAPGQVSVREMRERYHVHRITPHTTLWALVTPDAMTSPLVPELNRAWEQAGRDEVILPFPITREDDPEVVVGLIRSLGFRLFDSPDSP